MTKHIKLYLIGLFCYMLTLVFLTIPAYAESNNNFDTLVWSDEFDGNSLDTSKWGFDVGNHGFGNEELQYYTEGNNNINVSDGMLKIIAKKEDYQGSQYTSAKVWTKGLHSFKYGRITARIKIPTGQGIWPAFWMLGDSYNWPKCGEIDIMEHINTVSTVRGTAHWSKTTNLDDHKSKGGDTRPLDFSVFHEYSIEWDENGLTWYCDGIQYNQLTKEEYSNEADAFTEKFFLILNVAVGGNWPGSPDSTTVFPSEMLVDYVRVYQKAENISTETTIVPENNTNSNINTDTAIVPENNTSNQSEKGNSLQADKIDTTPKTSDLSCYTLQIFFVISIISGISIIITFIKIKKEN